MCVGTCIHASLIITWTGGLMWPNATGLPLVLHKSKWKQDIHSALCSLGLFQKSFWQKLGNGWRLGSVIPCHQQAFAQEAGGWPKMQLQQLGCCFLFFLKSLAFHLSFGLKPTTEFVESTWGKSLHDSLSEYAFDTWVPGLPLRVA